MSLLGETVPREGAHPLYGHVYRLQTEVRYTMR